MFIMAVPLKETEASLLLKGETRAGLSMNGFSAMSQTWSSLPWVAGTAFSVGRLDEELLFIPPPTQPLLFPSAFVLF